MRGFRGPLWRTPRPFRSAGLGVNETTQARFTQVGLEAWVVNTPAELVTQLGLEAWIIQDQPATPLSARARLGPRGFLGVPPRRFRESNLYPVGAANFTTRMTATQVGLEAWVVNNPTQLVTQVGLELWIITDGVSFTPPPFLWVST